MTFNTALELTTSLRARYRAVRDALPWFDVDPRPEIPPAFTEADGAVLPPCAHVELARPGQDPAALQARGVDLLRYRAAEAEPDALAPLLRAMAAIGMPLAVLHTEIDFDGIERLAGEYPRLPIVIQSGDRKLLYHIDRIESAMRRHENLYLGTYNFANWLGHEQFIAAGLGKRLLFGTHAPCYAPDVVMGPIVMSALDWDTKCALAGNNLRRLLGRPEVHPPERPWQPTAPFVVDAHTHNQQAGDRAVNGFPTPDMAFAGQDWTHFMDGYACELMILIPSEALFDHADARTLSGALRDLAPDRFRYMAIFNPHRAGPEDRARLEQHLRDPACAAIKIHPTSHKVEADDPSYAPAYALAARFRKPIMSHSWDVSDYNPTQYMSHPDRFRAHLVNYPDTTLILGHAGGRPGAFDATVRVCRDFPNVQVDFAGDYYHAGVLEAFARAIGPERMLFASDVDWFDPRCNLGLFLGSGLSDEALAHTLRLTAHRVYLPEASDSIKGTRFSVPNSPNSHPTPYTGSAQEPSSSALPTT